MTTPLQKIRAALERDAKLRGTFPAKGPFCIYEERPRKNTVLVTAGDGDGIADVYNHLGGMDGHDAEEIAALIVQGLTVDLGAALRIAVEALAYIPCSCPPEWGPCRESEHCAFTQGKEALTRIAALLPEKEAPNV